MGQQAAPYEAGLSPLDRLVEEYAANPNFQAAVLVAQWIGGLDPETVLESTPQQWVRRLAQAKVVQDHFDKTPRGRSPF